VYCPQCGAEYRPGFVQCSDCLVPLVDRLPEDAAPPSPPAPAPASPSAPAPAPTPPSAPAAAPTPDALHRHLELVTVFKTGDPGLIALVKSILQSADIPFTTRGEGIQDLTGLGRLGSGYNLAFGPVEIQVNRDDAEDARALLEDLETGTR
jgi:hypothetical protein